MSLQERLLAAAARARAFVDRHQDALVLVGFLILAVMVFVGLLRISGREARQAERVVVDAAAQIATTTVEKADALGAVAGESHERIGKIEDRTRRAVARVREAGAKPPQLAAPAGDGLDPVDRAFYGGVCASPYYRTGPVCDGRGERHEGGDPGRGP